MIPFCASCGGGLHEALILTGPVATTLNSIGGLLGPVIRIRRGGGDEQDVRNVRMIHVDQCKTCWRFMVDSLSFCTSLQGRSQEKCLGGGGGGRTHALVMTMHAKN